MKIFCISILVFLPIFVTAQIKFSSGVDSLRFPSLSFFDVNEGNYNKDSLWYKADHPFRESHINFITKEGVSLRISDNGYLGLTTNGETEIVEIPKGVYKIIREVISDCFLKK